MATLLKLVALEVDNLFGIYKYHLAFHVHDGVTILHGANGVGKTTILKMIDAFARTDLNYFHLVPFDRFCLRFHGDLSVEIGRCEQEQDTYVLTLVDEEQTRSEVISFGSLRRARSIAEKTDFLFPSTNDSSEWIDERDGEVLSVSDVIRRHGKSHDEVFSRINIPPWLRDFSTRIAIHLIETNRLARRAQDVGTTPPRWTYPRRPRRGDDATVIKYGRGLRDSLRDTMAAYGRQSQALDQSFPARLLSKQEQLDKEELRQRMAAIENRNSELTTLGVLNQPLMDTFDFTNLDETEARVLTQHVKDTEVKLSVFDDFAARVRVLLRSLNSKFQHKVLRLDGNEGLVAETERGTVGLSMLSSGEQHELVLHYVLLFRARENEVVLIDEPELSLHVSWQKGFIDDLLAMREVAGFDTLIATHSPYIAGRHSNLMIPLGDAT